MNIEFMTMNLKPTERRSLQFLKFNCDFIILNKKIKQTITFELSQQLLHQHLPLSCSFCATTAHCVNPNKVERPLLNTVDLVAVT